MSNPNVVIRDNRFQEFMVRAPQEASRRVKALAFEGEAYVKLSFGTSPSSPGDPPGVDTGHLRASISVQSRGAFAQAIVVGADYGVHLEYGTSKMDARPFMGPLARWIEGRIPEFFDEFFG